MLLSDNALYHMDEAQKQLEDKRQLLDVKVETQVILQLLVQKGIVTREEVADMRNKVRNSPVYTKAYQILDAGIDQAKHYQENPEEHLRAIMKAKLDGGK